jgi:hypothetical protein
MIQMSSTIPAKTPNTWQQKIIPFAVRGIFVTLTLLPIINIIFIIATTGENNMANDAWRFAILIDKVLEGTYHWQNIFRDTFINNHVLVLPLFINIGVAYFAHWNVYFSIYLGIGLVALKVILIYDAFTCLVKNPFSYLLWPLLVALAFSVSQISTFESDFGSIIEALTQLGFVFGIWGLVRFSERWSGIILMAIGGIIACWSRGSGPLVWPVYLIGLSLLNFRRVSYYVVWFIIGVLATFPYLYFQFLKKIPGETNSIITLFNFPLIVQAIGWPFAENFSLQMAYSRGLAGVVLCLIGVGILFLVKRNKLQFTQSTPALMLIIFSIINMWQVSVFRSWLVPWYASPFMLFWIGLLGLAYVLLKNNITELSKPKLYHKFILFLSRIWSIIFVGILVFFYLTSNLTYRDKSFLLRQRSPVSASCLRNYKTAPTYCEQTLFAWGPGNLRQFLTVGEILERHHLSVFAPHQRWTLQGDFILDNVRLEDKPGSGRIFWTKDLKNKAVPFSDYQHLNLFLVSPNSAEWTVSLPKNLKQAEFHSAVAISQSAPHNRLSDGLKFEVGIESAGQPPWIAITQYIPSDAPPLWKPIQVPLSQYAGQTIKIRLGSQMGANLIGDWLVYRYPYIDVTIDPNVSVGLDQEMGIHPSNTDQSPSLAKSTKQDFLLYPINPGSWKINDMQLIANESGASATWIVGNNPMMEYSKPFRECLSDYTYLYVRMATSENINPSVVKFVFQINGSAENKIERTMSLLTDGKVHEYTYDLKLLELNSKSRITGLQFYPVTQGTSSSESRIQISDLRLIRSDQDSFCL